MSTCTAWSRSGYPIAEKLVARMKREVRDKVVELKSVIAGRALAPEPAAAESP